MQSKEEKPYLELLDDELSLALGRAVRAFSEIEVITYAYMRHLSKDSLHELMNGQSFQARIKLIEKLIQRLDVRGADKETALACIDRAHKLADDRNTIAHNPWQIYIDFDRRDLVAEIKKYTNQNKKLGLSDVRAFTVKAQSIAEDLKDALHALVMQPNCESTKR